MQGFGTVGFVHSDENDADYTGEFFHPRGAGYSHSWAGSPDSKIGLQVDAVFSDCLRGVLQVVSQYSAEANYAPEVEWANLAYAISPDADVRIGRFVASTFMFSESRMVGYAQTWIRPPREVYSVMPITNKDGIDFSYRLNHGAATHLLDFSFGGTSNKLPGGGDIKVDHYIDVHDTVSVGDLTLHAGYTSLIVDFSTPGSDALFNGLLQFGAAVPGPAGQQAIAIYNQRRYKNAEYSIATMGASYDPGKWVLNSEWGSVQARNPTFVSDFLVGYVMGAYRFGNLTPYVSISGMKANKPPAMSIPTAGLPAPAAGNAATLNAGVAAIVNAFAISQSTVSAGMRWDFHRNVDLKLQYDRIRTTSGSNGWFVNVQPGFKPGEPVNVFSVALDFVF